jgi:hypothetical protein
MSREKSPGRRDRAHVIVEGNLVEALKRLAREAEPLLVKARRHLVFIPRSEARRRKRLRALKRARVAAQAAARYEREE